MEQNVLIITAVSLGFLHTLFGPDHYIPFIAISKARNWSLSKTLHITFLCGLGHVFSSIIIGIIGLLAGFALTSIKTIESNRGDIAAWLLIIFGLVYMIYGIRSIYRNKPHKHIHFHRDGTTHTHVHNHQENHIHVHENKEKNITPWVLFIIFVFGPCEVLIPLLMYPAAQSNITLTFWVIMAFGITTIATMLIIVAVSYFGIQSIKWKINEKFIPAIAGATILLCGVGMKFLGL